MRLQRPAAHGSFYESFSDLIFSAMAIFVLVIIVLVSQVRPEPPPIQELRAQMAQIEQALAEARAALASEQAANAQLEQEVVQLEEAQQKAQAQQAEMAARQAELEARVAELERQQEQLEARAKQAEENAVRTRSLELVVAVDGTGSMGPPLNELQRSIRSIAEALPLITPEFKLGMVIYRDTLDTFPLQPVLPEATDRGASLAAVYGFTERLQPQKGRADVEGAIRTALGMFTRANARRIFLLLGDVGPYEFAEICPDAPAEQSLAGAIRGFAAQDPDARIFALYSTGPPEEKYCPLESQAFFRALAEAAGEHGSYSDDVAKLLPFLLQGVLGVQS